MKHVLITGGAGFIGSTLALRLLGKGYSVTVLDNLHPQIHGNDPDTTSPLYQSIRDKVRFIKGDVVRRADWEKALEGVQVIVHFAAETGTGQSMYEIERYTQVNVGGTAILLDYLTNHTHQVEKVVVASSRAIYGEGKYYSPAQHKFHYPVRRLEADMRQGCFELRNPDLPEEWLEAVATDEESRIQPNSIYGLTKYHQEQSLMICCHSLAIPCVAFRYQNVYGPGQSLSNPYTGILSIFSNRIRQGNPINIFEDGKESRDFVYIDDVVEATMLGIEKQEANGEAFNVGTGIATSVLEVAQALMQAYGREVECTVSGQYRLGDIRHNFADLNKLTTVLGFRPAVAFRDGIQRFADWVNGQIMPADRYEQSLAELQAKGLFK